MINRIIVHPINEQVAREEIKLLVEIHKAKLTRDVLHTAEIVFLLGNKDVFTYESAIDSIKLLRRENNLLLTSFKELPKLFLLRSLGLTDNEIHEVFRND